MSFADNLYLHINPYKNYAVTYASVFGGNPVIPDLSLQGDYRIDVIYNGYVIFSQSFPQENVTMFYDGIGVGGTKDIEQPIKIYVPYISSDQLVKLYYKGNSIGNYEFSYICNKNNVCDEKEDYLSCPSECSKENLQAYNLSTVLEEYERDQPGILIHPIDKLLEPTPSPPRDALSELAGILKKHVPYFCIGSVLIIFVLAIGYYFGKRKLVG
ncbi:MAG: hypothetical protein Q7S22_03305 [Candidatus Micrarchaeota archaeon]|nr:hypothetical protein [Candidatus Micrarchaeota archaeon]